MSSGPPNERRPRVLHAITHLALGGAPLVALDLAKDIEGVDSAVCAVNGVADDAMGEAMRRTLFERQIPLFVGPALAVKRGGLLLAGLALMRAVDRFRPDIIHLHTEIPEAAYATMVSLRPGLRRIRVVRTIHNSIFWRYWPRIGRWTDRRLAQAFIAAVSQDARREFLRYRADSGAGPLPRDPIIIYNGVVTPSRQRARFGSAPREVTRVLFAGRFEFQKGTDLLPEILSRVPLPAGHRAELSIYGTGAHEPMLRELAARPPAGWSVQLHRPLPGLAERMADFDLLIVPSRFEGLCLVAIEAAVCGLPVIATDGPGIHEVFPPDYPWLARAGDPESFARHLETALAAPETWDAVAQRALVFARAQCDPAVALTKYRALYADVLAASA